MCSIIDDFMKNNEITKKTKKQSQFARILEISFLPLKSKLGEQIKDDYIFRDLILPRLIEQRRERGKRRVTYLIGFSEWLTGRRQRGNKG